MPVFKVKQRIKMQYTPQCRSNEKAMNCLEEKEVPPKKMEDSEDRIDIDQNKWWGQMAYFLLVQILKENKFELEHHSKST